jgi:MoaA/NifB/PqqE/SkfB family radical SAM enzyme
MTPAPRRLELHLSYLCGQHCVFCSESLRMARWRKSPLRGEEIAATLLRFRREGFDHLTVTGGEPTAVPALPAALASARLLGYKTYLTTNGGRFAEDAYARQVLPLLDELCLSVHGPDAATHDACAGTEGSFARAMKALDRVERRGPGVRLLTNTVVTRRNWERLDETLALLRAHPKVAHCLVSNVAPEGRASRAYRELAVPLEAWRRRVPELARPFAGSPAVLRFFGLPLCVLGGRTELSNDAHFSPRATVERRARGGRPALARLDSADASRRREKPAACLPCADRETCAGAFDRYLAEFGATELAPRKES